MDDIRNEAPDIQSTLPPTSQVVADTSDTAPAPTMDSAPAPSSMPVSTDAEIAPAPQADAGGKNARSKRKSPAFILKFAEYLKTHEDVRQMVMFFMFSIICGVTQMVITYGLSAGLKLDASLTPNFKWFVFEYDTTAEFIGFLVGSVVGQVLTFMLNRKKTFNVPNYLVMRAVMYAIMAILIIIMQTYLGGVVTKACWNARPDANGILGFLFNITGQAVAGIAALIINFLGNKFFVMRDWGGKIKKANEEKAREEAALAAGDEPLSLRVDSAPASDSATPYAAAESADLSAQASSDVSEDK